ncbi:uncharacterized [Tachysurus ichikawai]
MLSLRGVWTIRLRGPEGKGGGAGEDEHGSDSSRPDEDFWFGRQLQQWWRKRVLTHVCSLTSAFLLFPETLTPNGMLFFKQHGATVQRSTSGMNTKQPDGELSESGSTQLRGT